MELGLCEVGKGWFSAALSAQSIEHFLGEAAFVVEPDDFVGSLFGEEGEHETHKLWFVG